LLLSAFVHGLLASGAGGFACLDVEFVSASVPVQWAWVASALVHEGRGAGSLLRWLRLGRDRLVVEVVVICLRDFGEPCSAGDVLVLSALQHISEGVHSPNSNSDPVRWV
jgi:hypothetical protein